MPTDHKQKTINVKVPDTDLTFEARNVGSFNRKEARELGDWQKRLNGENIDDLWAFAQWLVPDETRHPEIDDLSILEVRAFVEAMQSESGITVGESSASSAS